MHIEFERLRQQAEQAPAGERTDESTDEPVEPSAAQSTRQLVIDLRRQWEEFQRSSNEVRYPNVMLHGVFQADAGWFDQSANSVATYGEIPDGAGFRRARLSANGDVWQNMKYFFQMDFAFFGRPTFTDVWTEINALPYLGNVRIGQWKMPFSLEVVSSFRYTMFMERSVLFQAFTPFRHVGVGFYNVNDARDSTISVAAFRTGQDQFGNSISLAGGNGLSGRLTYLPYYDEPSGGRYYLHTGLGYYLNSPPNHLVRFRTVPEIFIGEQIPGPVGTSGQAVPGALNGTPFFVDTGPVRSRFVNTFGTELLFVSGPLTIQSETMAAVVEQIDNPLSALWGFYVETGYMLTGEHRPYDRTFAMIDRIHPFESFFRTRRANGTTGRGSGAWESCFRVSYINLNNNNIQGGRMTDLTFGLNWYLNPYAKWVFNYIHSMPDVPVHGKSTTNIFATMVQMDF